MSAYLKKNNYLSIYLFIIIGINLFLQSLPLTNVFGYEFSAINALLLSFISGLYVVLSLKSLSKKERYLNYNQLFTAWFWMLILPIGFSLVNSIIFGFCSFCDGILFYLVIVCPSVIIGSAVGALTYFLVNKFRVLFFLFIYLLILFIPVLEIYFNPQVYLYNPLLAYFPGTIYDEGLRVDFNLFLYRFYNLIFFLPLLIYSIKRSRKSVVFKNRFSFAVITLLIAAVFYFMISPSLGYATTQALLEEHLSNKVESEHFIIHADKRIEKDEVRLIVLNQEFYYQQLKKYFKEEPKTKINSYIFYDSQQKKSLFGSGAADVAKPWLNSIYVSMDTWENTLKHEIAHCFTAGFGSGIFKLASGFNPALIEGVAEAADGIYHENDIHYLASLAYKNDYRVSLSSIFTSFSFFGSVSTLSYIYSGSFIKYLVDDFGIQKVKEFYQKGEFEKSFSADLYSIIDEYNLFLDTLTIYSTTEKANYYFGRKALISKNCPRYVASELTRGWDFYSSKNYKNAKEIFENVLSKAESYSAIVGLSKIYEDSDSLESAIGLLHKNLGTFSGTSTEFNLKFRLAELYVKNDKLENARELYEYLSKANAYRRLEQLVNTRIELLKNGALKKYVAGSDFDRFEIIKQLNSKKYNYSSIPLMIDLSERLDEEYQSFLSFFEKDIEVKNEASSYAAFKLSQFMLKHFDYVRARKMAGIALRYKSNLNLLDVTKNSFTKADWFLRNADAVFQKTKFELY